MILVFLCMHKNMISPRNFVEINYVPWVYTERMQSACASLGVRSTLPPSYSCPGRSLSYFLFLSTLNCCVTHWGLSALTMSQAELIICICHLVILGQCEVLKQVKTLELEILMASQCATTA